MSKIEDIVDRLENKISKVLQQQLLLKKENEQLEKAIQESQLKLSNQIDAFSILDEKYQTLKMANTLLGSDNDKKQTKLKINALIRDIDHCISQLSE